MWQSLSAWAALGNKHKEWNCLYLIPALDYGQESDRWESAGWSSIILYNPCSTPLLLPWLAFTHRFTCHNSTFHFFNASHLLFHFFLFHQWLKVLLLQFSLSLWGHTKRVMGRQRWEKPLHKRALGQITTRPAWSRLQSRTQRNTKYLLLQKFHTVHRLCFTNIEMNHLWDVWVGGFSNSMYYSNKHKPMRTVHGEVG